MPFTLIAQVYTLMKQNMVKIDEIYLNFEAIDGSVVIGRIQSILNSFVVTYSPGYIVFCEPKTIHCKSKLALNTITVYLDDDKYKAVNFNGKRWLCFTILRNQKLIPFRYYNKK